MAEFQHGRPMLKFAPSFRDCFTTLAHLGISYVWIDTFCILQGTSEDSRRDWEIESLVMEQVYAHSVLNVCAAHGVDSTKGCFKQRRMTAQMLRWRPLSAEAVRTFVLHSDDVIPRDMFNRHHLFTRAWVVQEMLLAPRSLHFGTDQIWWQCLQKGLISENDLHHPRSVPPGTVTLSSGLKEPILNPGILETHPDQLHKHWYRLMEKYTSCTLSQPNEDKLRAIQGIANRIARSTDDDYVEGYLCKELPAALCWVTYKGTPSPHHRAPSWSWASMDGPLFFAQRGGRDQKTNYSTLAAVVGTSVSCPGSRPRPNESPATVLQCVGRPIRVPQPVGFGGHLKPRLMSFTLWNTCFRTQLDAATDESSAMDATYSFLPILRHKENLAGRTTRSLFGLVLEQGTDSLYVRRGAVPYPGVEMNESMMSHLCRVRPQFLRIR
ncbi:hypothetical protein LTR17_011344 [Elasticomyces elasticus]|nr:hypothetical protein LTR17_011344 [Elasticomyces elasticus]